MMKASAIIPFGKDKVAHMPLKTMTDIWAWMYVLRTGDDSILKKSMAEIIDTASDEYKRWLDGQRQQSK